jgi:DNA-binding MarR family transcriptional regulator
MIDSKYMNLSPKEYMVMEALFVYRGVTIDHLLDILGYDKKGITNMYKPIQSLTKLGYISAHVISPKRSKKIYYLSSYGYSKMLELLEIPYGHIGTGYNQDYGDFSYELYKPPSSQKIHHLLLVEFLIKANKFKKEIEKNQKVEHSFDYRDNRYAARKYMTLVEKEGAKPQPKKGQLRPDAEVRFNSNICFVEIDIGTERGTHLTEKFEGYRIYFDHLTKNNQPLPSSILFISEEKNSEIQKNRRWQTISKKFIEALGDYTTSVNLIYETINTVEETLLREYTAETNRNRILAKIRNYDKSKSTPIFAIEKKQNFKWGKVNFSISDSDYLYPYERVEGYETRGWAILWKFNEYMKNEHIRIESLNNKKGIIPVLFFKNTPPKPIEYYNKIDKDGFFDNYLHFKDKGVSGTWQNKDLIELENNPITKT